MKGAGFTRPEISRTPCRSTHSRGATKALQEIYNADDRAHAEKAIEAFAETYGEVAQGRREDHQRPGELLAFYDFPAEHWIRLRTTNPMESTFSTVKLRTKVTRGAGSPARPRRWCSSWWSPRKNAGARSPMPPSSPLVRSGARFGNGVLVGCEEASAVA
ncbi:transposase [Streptomyces sp. enrichment culture]|uniref:transposase n=1 Tax=Streptomyces sp. enrichment culture TaxID=1795815 RepID=UPI003F56A64A